MKLKYLLTLLLPLASAQMTSAAITINSASGNVGANPNNVAPFTISRSTSYSAFTAAGAGKLIVLFSSRQMIASTLEYGGVPLTQAVTGLNNSNNNGGGTIYFLDNPTVDGDLVITGGAQNSLLINLYAVSGLASGGPALGLSTTDFSPVGDPTPGITLSLTTGSSGGVVVASAGSNGTVTPTVTSGTFNTHFGRAGNASWIDNTGSTTYTYSTTGVSAGAMAIFAPVPEPSSVFLAGLTGGLFLLRRRRVA